MAGLTVGKDNRQQWRTSYENAVRTALMQIGMTAETYAKKACPVDTGRLRNSITHQVGDAEVVVGTNVEYAAYVELGTSRTKAQPFLKPAAADHASKYSQILKQNLKSAQ